MSQWIAVIKKNKELALQLQAAAALAKATRWLTSRLRDDYKGVLPGEIDDVEDALAAYDKARGLQ